ncbi:hypothetical protein FV139_17270 [Parahaliea maris]|uniref:Uncharacterized protein n=1 Tax=Parahaliea maris TaxID=2716870 RepID=A0A5C8ZTY5_9GAMM|nr:hypothetical protein [Parahaliea maris]TXS90731.1 hypothetical protein FV139_17270 [Parahaliea maris]
MSKLKPLAMICLVGAVVPGVVSTAHAGFFDQLKDAVEDTAKRTAEALAVEATQDIIRGMIIGYSSEQTRTSEEVSKDYEKQQGSRPVNTTVAAYRTEILPGAAVSPGTKVRVKSYIEVVEGSSGKSVTLEERLTIWDNEDNTVALKSMTKEAGEKGGGFTGEFSFTLPEGLPQGVYPVSSDLMLNGELVGDERHTLQLVFVGDSADPGWRLALAD